MMSLMTHKSLSFFIAKNIKSSYTYTSWPIYTVVEFENDGGVASVYMSSLNGHDMPAGTAHDQRKMAKQHV